ncbi:LLM class F420-dependent oxidoreductase [Streptomyces fuscigenes]|uniref:LLM class F420-dependent oxidoreductase n=1 Tax=Streptomyces fuscigenes TaxID=1528880 RepID=UPI001F3BBA42|nr:LLM class F420-dependent oxidoreductase [Streptomyces fuscigenes]MCF3965199.1 LLM class F420-dependent oxidoreductase [Streptomyces fuscigenes]
MNLANTTHFGTIGVWSSALRTGNPRHGERVGDAAAELESLGYGTVWLGGSPSVEEAGPLLEATTRLTVATGILSIWDHGAREVAAARARLERGHPGRFVLGLGASHSALTKDYARPYSTMKEYLTALDEAPEPVPAGGRVLAALGPKMLELARGRAAGAHPYLVTAEHTAGARELLGPDALLAPELKVVLDPDLTAARATARAYLGRYLRLPNYTKNLERLGFSGADFEDGGSDRLLDAVFGLGDAEAVARRVGEFLAAGADQVAVQVVTADPATDLPLAEWRALAEVLPMTGA